MRYFGMPARAWSEGDKLHIVVRHQDLKLRGYPDGEIHVLLSWDSQPNEIKQAVEGKKS